MKPPICWQYAIKRELRRQGHGMPVRTPPSATRVVRITTEAAGAFILKYEWLGNMGRSKYCFGLDVRDEMLAVVCFGPLVSNTHFAKMLGPAYPSRILQLCRGASSPRAPKWAPSRLIGEALRLVAHDTSACGIVAYADPTAGEVGTIYQATNALYLGQTCPGGSKRYCIHGHWYDPRRVFDKYGSRSAAVLRKVDPDYKSIPVHPKHRYFWPTGGPYQRRAMRQLMAPYIQPYPSRMDLIDVPPIAPERVRRALRAITNGGSDAPNHFAALRPVAHSEVGYTSRFASLQSAIKQDRLNKT